jgi:uncharacterized protein
MNDNLNGDTPLALMLQHIPGAMNHEQIDGFFTALICSPKVTLPSSYMPEIIGGHVQNNGAFASEQEILQLFGLLRVEWERIETSLADGFAPFLGPTAQGNDWAKGFLRGVALVGNSWKALFLDDEHGSALAPILALAHEHTTDPRLQPYAEPIDAGQRLDLIAGIASGIPEIYRYFEAPRLQALLAEDGMESERSLPKTGRNELCPCGSGLKYKKCCNVTLLH